MAARSSTKPKSPYHKTLDKRNSHTSRDITGTLGLTTGLLNDFPNQKEKSWNINLLY
jgi:hypothetical protein